MRIQFILKRFHTITGFIWLIIYLFIFIRYPATKRKCQWRWKHHTSCWKITRTPMIQELVNFVLWTLLSRWNWKLAGRCWFAFRYGKYHEGVPRKSVIQLGSPGRRSLPDAKLVIDQVGFHVNSENSRQEPTTVRQINCAHQWHRNRHEENGIRSVPW